MEGGLGVEARTTGAGATMAVTGVTLGVEALGAATKGVPRRDLSFSQTTRILKEMQTETSYSLQTDAQPNTMTAATCCWIADVHPLPDLVTSSGSSTCILSAAEVCSSQALGVCMCKYSSNTMKKEVI